MTIQAVIWDFGGVLTSSPFEAFNRFERERALPQDFIRRVNATRPDHNAWARFERSEIDAAGFDELFASEARELGCDLRGAEILPLLSGRIRPRMALALKACKARFKVGCITNNVSAGLGAGMAGGTGARAEIELVLAEFDRLIESSKVGVRKPDPRIYQMMCAELHVAPEACVYLDDLGVNCKPAAKLGMRAIKVESEGQALAELSRVLGFDLTSL